MVKEEEEVAKEEEEEEEEFITSGNWRGKHNSLGDRIKNTEGGGWGLW